MMGQAQIIIAAKRNEFAAISHKMDRIRPVRLQYRSVKTSSGKPVELRLCKLV
jgi:hypothetical protein